MIINLNSFGGGGGSEYILPTATASRLGGIKVGSNLSIESDGTLSAQAGGSSVVELTQAEYDALEVKEPDVIYVISDAPMVDLDATSLKPVDELPTDAEDGQLVNYNGRIARYTENAEWGKWVGMYNQPLDLKNGKEARLYYDYLPSSLHHTKMAEYRYGGSYYGTTLYLFFDLDNNQIVVYTTDTPDFSTEPTYVVNEGETKTWSNFGIGSGQFEWQEGYFRFFNSNYNIPWNVCSTSITGEGWEFIDKQDMAIGSGVTNNNIIAWDKEGRVIGKMGEVYMLNINVNTTGYTNSWGFYGSSSYSPSRMFVPTQSGTQGQVLQSAGNGEPTWIDKSAVTNGISFWTGTQDEYDALSEHNASTLYLIVED